MKNIANKNIWEIKPYVPGKPLDEVQRQLGLEEVIKLASNESPYGPSLKVRKAIAQAAKNINRYPDGNCFHLRRALAKKLQVPGDQLIFGNGSDEIILLTVRAFTQADDEVIMAQPSFLMYEIAAKIAGATPVRIPLKNFRYDLPAMKAAVTPRTKMIFIGNPDNPAGTYVTHAQVQDFLKGLPEEILVFLDEAYFEFVRKTDYPDTISLLKRHQNIIITRTFSKMYGLAGLRVGYGIADKEVMDILNRIREPFNVNSLAQAAALACLEDNGYYQRLARKIEKERLYLSQRLKKMGVRFVETVTNFLLLEVGQNGSQLAGRLLNRGIIVRDMSYWGLTNFIRVTIGTHKENQKFIQALRGIL